MNNMMERPQLKRNVLNETKPVESWSGQDSFTRETEKTLTTRPPFQRGEQPQDLILRSNQPATTDRLVGTPTILSKRTVQKLNEKQIADKLAEFFTTQGWEYRREWPTKSGKAIDFLVKAPYDGGYIFFGVECKKELNDNTNATILADYLEQASAYSKDLELPVFLAPVISGASPSEFYHGNRELSRLAGLTIYGGRFNVGILVKQDRFWGGNFHTRWFSILRGGTFWEQEIGFNPKRLHIVCSTGSEKERKELKVWK